MSIALFDLGFGCLVVFSFDIYFGEYVFLILHGLEMQVDSRAHVELDMYSTK